MDVVSSPNVIPWPPILLMTAIVSAHVMGGIVPFAMRENSITRTIGSMTIVAGILVDMWAIITMRRSKTNIFPHRAAERLVTSGPFRFSRNPIYLGNAVLCVGLALMTGNVWFIVTATFMVAAVDRLAVRREERHLESRFGETWLRYRKLTPRWLIRL